MRFLKYIYVYIKYPSIPANIGMCQIDNYWVAKEQATWRSSNTAIQQQLKTALQGKFLFTHLSPFRLQFQLLVIYFGFGILVSIK